MHRKDEQHFNTLVARCVTTLHRLSVSNNLEGFRRRYPDKASRARALRRECDLLHGGDAELVTAYANLSGSRILEATMAALDQMQS